MFRRLQTDREVVVPAAEAILHTALKADRELEAPGSDQGPQIPELREERDTEKTGGTDKSWHRNFSRS